MNTSIKNILASWESSLIRFQKIDCWNYSENLATLGWYLHNNNCTIEEYYLIKYVRDSIIGVNFNVKSVLNAIQKLMNMETAKEKDFTSILVKMDGNRIVLNGQDVRFMKRTSWPLRTILFPSIFTSMDVKSFSFAVSMFMSFWMALSTLLTLKFTPMMLSLTYLIR